MKHAHILIIGGTGMLAGASATLARRCERLTMVARTRVSLDRCDRLLHGPTYRHQLVADWTDQQRFLGALSAHVEDVGHPDLLLAWLHVEALGPAVVRAVVGRQHRCTVYQVRSSAAGEPAADPDAFPGGYIAPANVTYRQVILGFHLCDGVARWLNHSEISEGVIEAIDSNAALSSVVGVVQPWSLQP